MHASWPYDLRDRRARDVSGCLIGELRVKMRRGHSGAVFFDRDGTLNRPARPGEYVRHPQDLKLLPGAAAAVRHINDAGLLAILATNQRWLAEPGTNKSTYKLIENKLRDMLAAEGAWLDASYTCSHAARSCDCRKPLPGLLLRAAKDFDLDLSAAFLIGDSLPDIQAGFAAGMRTILISARPDDAARRLAHRVVGSIEEAVAQTMEIMEGELPATQSTGEY
jgi:D-glycero-D-manno-heptose 1,7-bisphosphate phosphatase